MNQLPGLQQLLVDLSYHLGRFFFIGSIERRYGHRLLDEPHKAFGHGEGVFHPGNLAVGPNQDTWLTRRCRSVATLGGRFRVSLVGHDNPSPSAAGTLY